LFRPFGLIEQTSGSAIRRNVRRRVSSPKGRAEVFGKILEKSWKFIGKEKCGKTKDYAAFREYFYLPEKLFSKFVESQSE